jgi:dihydrolipoamide dehydrogenase
VKSNVDGVAFLMKKNKIDVHTGTGKVLGEGKVSVTGDDGKATELKRRISSLPPAPTSCRHSGRGDRYRREGDRLVDRRAGAGQGAGQSVVVGGGVIGLELGSVWNRSAPR